MLKLSMIATCMVFVFGCSSPSNTDSLREHTADATAAAKRDATAIVRGIAEGITRKGPLDINKASVQQLAALPGINTDLANAMINQRPYTSTRDLVRKHVLSSAQFNRIKAQIAVQ